MTITDLNCFISYCEISSASKFNSIRQDELKSLEASYEVAKRFGEVFGFESEFDCVKQYVKDYKFKELKVFEKKYYALTGKDYKPKQKTKEYKEPESLYNGSWKIIEEEVVEIDIPF